MVPDAVPERIKHNPVSMNHWSVVENLRHRLRITSGIERETRPAMGWAEAEMLLQLADAFRRTQPVWFEHFLRQSSPVATRQIEALRAALQPFADMYDAHLEEHEIAASVGGHVPMDDDYPCDGVPLGKLRMAKEALR